jgi:hypothetical protein
MSTDIPKLITALQNRYVSQLEFRDHWSNLLFSEAVLTPVFEATDIQIQRAFLYARPNERPEPIDEDVAYNLLFNVITLGPKYFRIQDTEQVETFLTRKFFSEYVVPRRYQRKNSFAKTGLQMVAPPPGIAWTRNPERWAPVKKVPKLCKGLNSRAKLLHKMKQSHAGLAERKSR